MDTFIASSEARKVWKIDDYLALTIAGAVGDAQELIRVLKAQNEIYKMNENRPFSPKSATSLLSIIMQENKMMPYYAELIIAGMDDDVPALYSHGPDRRLHPGEHVRCHGFRIAHGIGLHRGHVQEGHDC